MHPSSQHHPRAGSKDWVTAQWHHGSRRWLGGRGAWRWGGAGARDSVYLLRRSQTRPLLTCSLEEQRARPLRPLHLPASTCSRPPSTASAGRRSGCDSMRRSLLDGQSEAAPGAQAPAAAVTTGSSFPSPAASGPLPAASNNSSSAAGMGMAVSRSGVWSARLSCMSATVSSSRMPSGC